MEAQTSFSEVFAAAKGQIPFKYPVYSGDLEYVGIPWLFGTGTLKSWNNPD
jgi:hypothetical protein